MRRSLPAVLASSALLALVACGTSDPARLASTSAISPAAATSPTVASSSGAADTISAEGDADWATCPAEVPTSTGPVSLTDSFGRSVELAAPAERVAVLEWQQVEDVLTLCLTPVAVADAQGYTLWDTAAALPAGVTDVGTRGEPNLDALFATSPDLVIIEAYTADDEIIGQLEKYDVPVLATKGADTADPVENMISTFELIGQAVGREERAEEVVSGFRSHLAAAKETISRATPAVTDFVYLDGWIQGGNVALRPFGQGSLMGELGEELGLTNVWKEEVDPAYGLGQTDIEGLTTVGDATLLYTGTVDPEADFIPELTKNEIWASLPAVKDGRASAFPPGIWTFGGPLSARQIVDAYVGVLSR
jgi:ABC-type Fe3+-hydroxamate transport system substrate-binding protein